MARRELLSTLALAGALVLGAQARALPSPSPTPVAWQLKLPAKSPQILPPLGRSVSLQPGQEASPLYPVREACVYAGLNVTWRAPVRSLRFERASGVESFLVLGEASLVSGGRRFALGSPLCLASGAPALSQASLQKLLELLSAQAPVWEAASSDALQAALASMAPQASAAEPLIEDLPSSIVAPPGVLPTPGPRKRGSLHKVVIDAGHGGHDPGATGKLGLEEKDSCLDIARRLQRELDRRAPELEVRLTRDKDEFISLRQRTQIANAYEADLFISIHNNASRNRSGHGTQVFFYDSVASDKAAGDLARRENADANYLDITMMDLTKQAVRDPSISLATKIQGELGKTLHLKNRTLSKAPFYVLARTKMPAVLVEVAFITNPEEERKLNSLNWRQQVAESIAAGVIGYRGQAELEARR